MNTNQNLNEIKVKLFNKQNGRCYYTNTIINIEELNTTTYVEVIEDKESRKQEMFLAKNNVRVLTKNSGPLLSKKLNFFFCHIPKNGGTSLRMFLEPIDEKYFDENTKKKFFTQLIDIGHIPLFIIEKELPSLYEFIKDADSYAVLRDPYKRFASSLSQRVRMYKNTEIGKLDESEINKEIDNTIKYLKTKMEPNTLLDFEYIHFQRQVDYVYNNDTQIIKHLFLFDEIEYLMQTLVDKYPDSCLKIIDSKKRIGATQLPKNAFSTYLGEFYRKNKMYNITPKKLVNFVKSIFLEDLSKTKINDLFLTPSIKTFINEYYAKDIKMYNEQKCLR